MDAAFDQDMVMGDGTAPAAALMPSPLSSAGLRRLERLPLRPDVVDTWLVADDEEEESKQPATVSLQQLLHRVQAAAEAAGMVRVGVREPGCKPRSPATVKDAATGRSSRTGRTGRTDRSDRICPVCMAEFKKPSALQRHYRSHTGDRPFGCRQCGQRFTESGNMGRHMREKHPADGKASRPFSCPVPSCTRRFNRKCHIVSHIVCRHQDSSARYIQAITAQSEPAG